MKRMAKGIVLTAGLMIVMLIASTPVFAATVFSDYTLDQDTGVLTVHSSVPDDAIWNLDANSVRKIIFDEGVTSIGYRSCYDSAFNKVEKITFSSSVKEIGGLAFVSGANLPDQEYVFSEGLETIGERAFSANHARVETLDLPSTLKSIGDGAFMNMEIKSLLLPSGIEYIGPEAFAKVWRFTDSIGANYTCMGGILYNKDITRLVQYPKYRSGAEFIAPNTLKVIGEKSINKPSGLSCIILPEGFEDIEKDGIVMTGSYYESLYVVLPSTLKHIGTGNFNMIFFPICYRGTREQWAAIDDEARDSSPWRGITSSDYEENTYFQYDIEDVSLRDITLSPGQSIRLYPSVTPAEPLTDVSAAARSTFCNNNDWVCWSLDDKGEVLADDTVIKKTEDYVDGSIRITALQPGEGGASVYAYGRNATCSIHVRSIPVNSGNVKPPVGVSAGNVHPGQKVQLQTNVSPSNATDKSVSFRSGNTSIATVSASGLVTFKKAGTVTITATFAGGVKASVKFTVKNIAVKSVKLSSSKITLKKGKTKKLKATIKPKNATIKTVTWKSSNKKVATVSSKGLIKARKKGTVTITVITKDGKKKAKCKVVVK